jgi:pyridoxal phosphate enzyme (YggS family)
LDPIKAAAIGANFKFVRDRVTAAADRAGRSAGEVSLVAVAKTRAAGEVRAAYDAGARVIGENRVQEAEPKMAALAGLACEWHMVGHLQRNKAAKAVKAFDVIQSLDSRRLADELARRAEQEGKRVVVLLEVNTSAEATKCGVAPEEAADFTGHVVARRELDLAGLMTVGPLTDDVREITRAFRKLKRLYDDLAAISGGSFKYLSMGMTDDFEIAISEGSNMVRIGRAIFGPR